MFHCVVEPILIMVNQLILDTIYNGLGKLDCAVPRFSTVGNR